MQVEKSAIRSGALVPMVAVLSNPKSTTNAEGMDKVRTLVRESANVVHFELGTMGDIDEALQLFARANPSLLVINGGDGTIGMVLASLIYRNPFSVVPPIAFLPGGKTNMTAADLGYKGCPSSVLKRLLRVVQRGEITRRLRTRNLIELDLNNGEEPKVGTFFGAAGVVKGIYWCRENAYSRGLPNWLAHFVSFSALVPALFGIGKHKDLLVSDPMHIKVRGTHQAHAGQFKVVLASTLDRVLLGLRPFGTVGMGGLQFSAVDTRRSTVWRGLTGLFTGSYGRGELDGVNVGRSDVIEIQGSDPVTLDGEIYFPDPDRPMLLKGSKSLTFVKL